MTTLVQDATDSIALFVTDTDGVIGQNWKVDDEIVLITGSGPRREGDPSVFDWGEDKKRWTVDRAVAGTTAASHSSGATLTRYYPDAPSPDGGGGLPTGVEAALTGAADPSAENVFATMADVGAGASRWLGPCKVNAFGGQIISTGGGDVDGGTFTLTLEGETTDPIAWNAGSAALIAAIEALPNVGAGNVALAYATTWSDVNGDAYLQFKDLTATALMTIDTSALTGPSAPYAGYSVGGSGSWLVEMLTPVVGDIIEDFMHAVPEGFDQGARLIYTDSPDSPEDVGSGVWAMPVSAQGIDGLAIDQQDDVTNFSGNGLGASAGDAQSRPTALTALIAQWAASAADATINLYQNLPAMTKNAVPIYAYLRSVEAAPTAGEVWIWVKVATPAPLMD